jgi:hypothetical protein
MCMRSHHLLGTRAKGVYGGGDQGNGCISKAGIGQWVYMTDLFSEFVIHLFITRKVEITYIRM